MPIFFFLLLNVVIKLLFIEGFVEIDLRVKRKFGCLDIRVTFFNLQSPFRLYSISIKNECARVGEM